jgi:hypothetical protein
MIKLAENIGRNGFFNYSNESGLFFIWYFQ